MVKKIGIVALVLALATPLWADEVSGKIQKVDTGDRTIVLEDGTQLWLAEAVSADILKEGATVKASYEEKDGKKVVTEIEVSAVVPGHGRARPAACPAATAEEGLELRTPARKRRTAWAEMTSVSPGTGISSTRSGASRVAICAVRYPSTTPISSPVSASKIPAPLAP